MRFASGSGHVLPTRWGLLVGEAMRPEYGLIRPWLSVSAVTTSRDYSGSWPTCRIPIRPDFGNCGFTSSTPIRKSAVELKGNRRTDFQLAKINVPGIQKKIALSGDQRAGHPQYRRGGVARPVVSNLLNASGCRFRSPIPGQGGCVDVEDVRLVDGNLKQDILLQEFRGVQVDQDLQHRQRLRLGGVDDFSAGAIPSPAIETSALARECRSRVLALGNAPSGDHQEKTPCSRRPMRSSTWRAPSSVRACMRGVS